MDINKKTVDNNFPLISIIIPIYKVEEYLAKCLKSVSKQSYKNIEVLLINDGSPDGSLNICKKFANNDSRFRIITQTNAGVSVARNNGIEHALGEYCCFVDSDDWVAENYVSRLYDEHLKNKCDLTVGGQIVISARKNILMPAKNIKMQIQSESFAHYLYIEKNQIAGPCCKLFRMDLIKNYNLRFRPEMKCGQDADFVFKYLSHCKDISAFNDYIYFYNRLNDFSSTKKYWADKHKWIEIILNDQLDLFLNCLNNQIKAMSMNYYILWFNRLIDEAAKFFDNPDEIANRIKIIDSTLSKYCYQNLISEKYCNNEWLEKYNEYYSFTKNYKYEELSKKLIQKKHEVDESRIKALLRKNVIKGKKLWLFRICV